MSFILPVPGLGNIDFGSAWQIPEDFGRVAYGYGDFKIIESAEGGNVGSGWETMLPGSGRELGYNTANSSLNGVPYGGSNPTEAPKVKKDDGWLWAVIVFLAVLLGLAVVSD